MIKNLEGKVIPLAEQIEAINSEHNQQREKLFNNTDLTAEAKKRQEWQLREEAINKAEGLYKQALAEVVEVQELLTRQQAIAQSKADNEAADPGRRAQVENIKEEMLSKLIENGPFEFHKTIAKLIDEEASPLRLEAARAILPQVKASLYEEMYAKETGGQVLDPWGEKETAITGDNSELIKVELQQTAQKLNDALKPERVKTYEADLIAVSEIENELTSAYNRTTRHIERAKPAGPEPGSPWDPEELKKPENVLQGQL